MYIAPQDATVGDEEWRPFVESQGFGHLVAAGRGREIPVVVPTQFLLDGDRVLLHLARPNPVFQALAEQPKALLSVAGNWAFIPSDWKAVGDEDPLFGIPTTYYGAVQLIGTAHVDTEPSAVASVLRAQLNGLQPGVAVADPEGVHLSRLRSIHAITLEIEDVRGKFKYGGNVDHEHRMAVAERLAERGMPGDEAAARETLRRDGLSR